MKQFIYGLILTFCICLPSFAQNNQTTNLPCPKLNLTLSVENPKPNEIVNFSVSADENAKGLKLNYKWIVSRGEIISGQATPNVKVKMGGLATTIVVRVNGFPKDCWFVQQKIFAFDSPTIKMVDSHIKSPKQYPPINKARLDMLTIEMQNQPEFLGYIYDSFDKKATFSEISRQVRRIYTYLVISRGIEPKKLIFSIDKTHQITTELWLIASPENIPECKNCFIIKGEEFEQRLKELAPKPKRKNTKRRK